VLFEHVLNEIVIENGPGGSVGRTGGPELASEAVGDAVSA